MRCIILVSCCTLAACGGQTAGVTSVPSPDGVFVATGRGAASSSGILIAQFTAMESANRTCNDQQRRFVPIADAVTVPSGGTRNTYAVRFACVEARDMAPAATRILPPPPPL